MLPRFCDISHREVQRDFYTEAGRGAITGASVVTMFGYSPASPGTGLPYNLWELQVPYSVPSTAQTLRIVSDSASDIAGGAGANTVLVTLLDGSFNQITQIVSMNGTTAVILQNGPFMVVNSCLVVTSGSNKTNVGNITIATSGSGATAVNPQGYIAAGQGAGHLGHFTVPAGFSWNPSNFFFVTNKSGGGNTNVASLTYTFTQPNGTIFTGLPVTITSGGPVTIDVAAGVPIPEKTTSNMVVNAVSVAGLDISFGCTGALVSNTI